MSVNISITDVNELIEARSFVPPNSSSLVLETYPTEAFNEALPLPLDTSTAANRARFAQVLVVIVRNLEKLKDVAVATLNDTNNRADRLNLADILEASHVHVRQLIDEPRMQDEHNDVHDISAQDFAIAAQKASKSSAAILSIIPETTQLNALQAVGSTPTRALQPIKDWLQTQSKAHNEAAELKSILIVPSPKYEETKYYWALLRGYKVLRPIVTECQHSAFLVMKTNKPNTPNVFGRTEAFNEALPLPLDTSTAANRARFAQVLVVIVRNLEKLKDVAVATLNDTNNRADRLNLADILEASHVHVRQLIDEPRIPYCLHTEVEYFLFLVQ